MSVKAIFAIVLCPCFLVGGYFLGLCGRKDNVGRPLINTDEAIYRKGEHLEESEERLARNSGFWATSDGVCGVDLDYRIISFSKSGYKGGWEELNGNKYLIGQGMDFMTNTGFYYIDCLDESEMILRKETFSSLEITWVDTVTFRKIDKSNIDKRAHEIILDRPDFLPDGGSIGEFGHREYPILNQLNRRIIGLRVANASKIDKEDAIFHKVMHAFSDFSIRSGRSISVDKDDVRVDKDAMAYIWGREQSSTHLFVVSGSGDAWRVVRDYKMYTE